MCGIAGLLDYTHHLSRYDLQPTAMAMADAMRHRGPDSSGVWADDSRGIALSHRRLAIVDLSPAGHQPMHSADGRFVAVFNGEIYNFRDLRHTLTGLGHTFRGSSDTEIMLAAICQWGFANALTRFVGMFALAVWDRAEQVLYLARDRFGEKPLYYGRVDGAFVFASELKALHACPGWTGAINRDALALFMRHRYVPAPYSIYRGITKLLPGTYLTLPYARMQAGEYPEPVAYWSARQAAEAGNANPFTGSDAEAIEHLDRLLREAIGLQMVADVPLGAFLSGGIDSSTIVALMQVQSSQPVKTFTIGFRESAYNEAEAAAAVAHHLGTDHTELYVAPGDALNVIPRLPFLYDEPFSDQSQIPTFLVAELTRQYVTVSLSGDAGDELFGGYSRYLAAPALWQRIGWLDPSQRYALARLLRATPSDRLDSLLGWLAPLLSQYGRITSAGERLHKVADILAAATPDALYYGLTSQWKQPTELVLNAHEPLTALTDSAQHVPIAEFAQRMMYLDAVSYLPDDILVKVDRASMGVSLESRVPFLDHRVAEFAWSLPLSLKIREGTGKWLLRQVLYRYVPAALVERPKTGFNIPLGEWLRGPLRAWAEDLLDERRLRDEGFFDPQTIRTTWSEHQAGRRNWHDHLWSVLMFQAWLQHQHQQEELVV